MDSCNKYMILGRRGTQVDWYLQIALQPSLQAAEKASGRGTKCQGTSSLVP